MTLFANYSAQVVNGAFIGAGNKIIRVERREISACYLPPQADPLVHIIGAAETVKSRAFQQFRFGIPNGLKSAFGVCGGSVKVFKPCKIIREQFFNSFGTNVVLPTINAVHVLFPEFFHLLTLVEMRIYNTEIVNRRMLPDSDFTNESYRMLFPAGAWLSAAEKAVSGIGRIGNISSLK